MDLQSPSTSKSNSCKYCKDVYEDITVEVLQCSGCQHYVHSKCLQRGTVPGGLAGDVFYSYKCAECSPRSTEEYDRDKMPWLQVILLVLYHMQTRKTTLARKGYFHWKIHIAAFIDQNWEILFRSDRKKKKKWIGTISGTLSHYSPMFFKSGTTIFNTQGWWTLTYPKLPPKIIMEINEELMLEKQKCKVAKVIFDNMEKLNIILQSKPYVTEAMLKSNDCIMDAMPDSNTVYNIFNSPLNPYKHSGPGRRKRGAKLKNANKGKLLPTVDNILMQSKRKNIPELEYNIPSSNVFKKLNLGPLNNLGIKHEVINEKQEPEEKPFEKPKFLDRLCHYSTTLENVNQCKHLQAQPRLTGNVRNDLLLSPYSSICLSPYISRVASLNPPWLQLLDELKCKVNCKNRNWYLEGRATMDFVYVQPDHIPILNSLCSQFFWNGINLTDILQYPEFTCVVLYKNLIVGFVCAVPNVGIDEIYLSFMFTRPAWRRCGIGRFMLYHIIQVSGFKNITLHVSTSNPALILFQKYGFKIQYLVKNFYEKYFPTESTECRDAFFCGLF